MCIISHPLTRSLSDLPRWIHFSDKLILVADVLPPSSPKLNQLPTFGQTELKPIYSTSSEPRFLLDISHNRTGVPVLLLQDGVKGRHPFPRADDASDGRLQHSPHEVSG